MITALLMVIPLAGQTGKDSRIFKARRQTNVTRSLTRTQMTASDTIPLQDLGAVYAFSIDATITQPREASFVRIVLEDTEGHDYLVAESDRFRNDTTTVQLSAYCEETAKLQGITPVCLKCYLAGDATLQFAGFHVSDQEPTRGQTANEETDAAIKEAQVQSIVDRINEYNARHGKLWRAGLNNWALAEYDSDIKGEGDAYTANFKYYVYGFYEMGERSATRDVPVSNPTFADSFDWRNRHGKNWIGNTIRDQGRTRWCSVFSTVAVTEAYINLYFNDTLYLDLSEQDVISYGPSNIRVQPNLGHSTTHVQTNGIIDEASLQYTGSSANPIDPRPEGIEKVSISFGAPSYWNGSSKEEWDNNLRYNLINYGPGILGYLYPYAEIIDSISYGNHLMALVGYGTINQQNIDDLEYYTQVSESQMSTSILSNNAIGQLYYIFKDSYGHRADSIYHHDGFRYIIFHDYSKIKESVFPYEFIYRRGHSDTEIKVEDLDGDGYFNWGIGERPDDRLPSWAAQEEDADDSNDTIGCFSDLYGHTKTLLYGWDTQDDYYYRTNGQTDSDSLFIRGLYDIADNATVSLTGTLIFHPQALLYLGRNSTLVIDGGTIVDPTFVFGTNTKVILKNGGKIFFTKRKTNFTFPIGISLEIQSGEIKYIRDYSPLMP